MIFYEGEVTNFVGDIMSNIDKGSHRPFLQRQEGEVGIYLTLYDADSKNPIGSEHFFKMNLMENLFKELSDCKMDAIRQKFDKYRLFDGCYIERIKPGVIIVLGFDGIENLDLLWKANTSDSEITKLLQDVVITPAILKDLEINHAIIKSKIYEDEYLQCKEELLARTLDRLNIANTETDFDILKRIKQTQKKVNNDINGPDGILKTQDDVEKKLGDFLIAMKEIVPKTLTTIDTLGDFDSLRTENKQTKKTPKHIKAIEEFVTVLQLLKDTFDEIYSDICMPMLRIHSQYETQKQKSLKYELTQECKEGRALLNPEADLRNLVHVTWQSKVLKKEIDLYRGLVCLVPVICDRFIDLSHKVDEYILDYPTIFEEK